jgi:hypothetical protein
VGKIPVIKLDGGDLQRVDVAPEDVVYVPSQAERLAKAAFWKAWEDNPGEAPEDTTVARIAQITGESRITKWFSKPLFRDWFMNKDVYVHKSRALAEAGQDLIWEMMNDPMTRPDLRAKLALEAMKNYASVLAATTPQGKYLDDSIAKMSPEELKTYIASLESKGGK